MTVTVRLFAVFRERVGHPEVRLELSSGATVAAAWDCVAGDQPDVQGLRDVTRFAVNGDYATPDTPLHEGDEVAFLPPMSGGA